MQTSHSNINAWTNGVLGLAGDFALQRTLELSECHRQVVGLAEDTSIKRNFVKVPGPKMPFHGKLTFAIQTKA